MQLLVEKSERVDAQEDEIDKLKYEKEELKEEIIILKINLKIKGHHG